MARPPILGAKVRDRFRRNQDSPQERLRRFNSESLARSGAQFVHSCPARRVANLGMTQCFKSSPRRNAPSTGPAEGASAAPSNSASIDPRAYGLVKAAYSVNETLDLLSIGRTSLYEAVKRGELKPVKFGKKTLFYAADLAAFLVTLRRSDEARSAGRQRGAPRE